MSRFPQLGQGQPVKIFDTVMGSDYEYFRLHWHKEVETVEVVRRHRKLRYQFSELSGW